MRPTGRLHLTRLADGAAHSIRHTQTMSLVLALIGRTFRNLVAGFVLAAIGIMMVQNALAETHAIREYGLFGLPETNAQMFWWGITLGPLLALLGFGILLAKLTGRGEGAFSALVAGGTLLIYSALVLGVNLYAMGQLAGDTNVESDFTGNLILGGVLALIAVLLLLVGFVRRRELGPYVQKMSRDQSWRHRGLSS